MLLTSNREWDCERSVLEGYEVRYLKIATLQVFLTDSLSDQKVERKAVTKEWRCSFTIHKTIILRNEKFISGVESCKCSQDSAELRELMLLVVRDVWMHGTVRRIVP